MTVQAHDGEDRYIGDDVTVAFPYGFKILDDDDIEFLINGVMQTKGTNYTVAGVGATNGGTITALNSPDVDAAVSLLRGQPISQLTNFLANETYDPLKIMRAFDKATMVDQMLAERIGRVPILAKKSTYKNLSLEDPVASQLLRWKADLSGIESVSLASVLAGISGITATLTAGRIVFASSASNLDTSANLLWDSTLNKVSVLGPGIWTNTDSNAAQDIVLNSMDYKTAHEDEQGGFGSQSALVLAAKVPVTTTAHNNVGLSVFVDSYNPLVGVSGSGVGIYVQVRAKVADANIFALNPLLSDEGFGGIQMQNELDFAVHNVDTSVAGLTFKGVSSVEPTDSVAIAIDKLDIGGTSDAAWKYLFFAAAGCFMGSGINFDAGAPKAGTEPSIQLGPLTTGNNSASQYISLIGKDAGGVTRSARFQAGADGSIIIRSGKNGEAISLEDFNGGNGTAVLIANSVGITLAANGGEIKWGRPLVAVGGGAAPTFGTIGGSGPAAASQHGWLRFLDSAGVATWVPVWR